jgi:DNA-binding response OmpR family regulator
MLSAVGGPFTRERCLQLGASDYFTKPYRIGEFFDRLEALAVAAKGGRAASSS